jgi:hypothetical protein
MRDDSRHGIAAAVVFAEYLAEKTPNGCDRVEHSVPILNAILIEDVQNVCLG